MKVKYFILDSSKYRTQAFRNLCDSINAYRCEDASSFVDLIEDQLKGGFDAKLIGHDPSYWTKEDYIIFPSEESQLLFLMKYE